MNDPSGEGSSSGHSPSDNLQSTSSGGFYDRFRAGKSSETPTRPAFLENSTNLDGVLESVSNPRDVHTDVTLYSNSSTTSVLSTSTFGSLKRKRNPEIVSKPSFKVSEFVGATPHLPRFGTSLTKVKFDFTSSNKSSFYSGRTKFGGSSSIREESTKRIKLSPVTNSARTSLTRVSAKPYSTDDKRTLTSKTAENILKTLNKICTPVKPPEKQPFQSEFSSSFSSLSKRLREKRKAGMSTLPPPPIARLNQIISAKIVSTNVNGGDSTIKELETKTFESETNITESKTIKISEQETGKISEAEVVKTPEVVHASEIKAVKVPEVTTEEVSDNACIQNEVSMMSTENGGEQENGKVQQTAVSKNNLKMKRQRTGTHYTASDKIEEPVNTMPEVTAIQPLVISALPKFDLSVKPASAPIFTPIMKLPKPVTSVKSTAANESEKFSFSTPKMVSNKVIVSPSLDMTYSFISPVSIKNPGTPILTKKVDRVTETLEKPPIADLNKIGCESKSEQGISNEQSSVVVVKDTKETTTGFTGFKIAKKEEGSWDCPTCMITNKPDCLKCVACTEPKPGSKEVTGSINPSFTFGQSTAATSKSGFSFNKSSVASSTFSIASTNATSSTGFTFSKPFSTVCSSGFSFGKSTQVTTTASEAKVQSSETETSSFGFGTPIPSKSEATFGNSFRHNNTTIDVFSTPMAEISKKTCNVESKGNLFDKLKPAAEGSWDCPTCMIKNAPEIQKCAACTEPKPGCKIDSSAPVNNKSEFKFGGTGNSSSANFSFGSTNNKIVPGGFTFGAPANNVNTSGFSFGKPSDKTDTKNPFEKLKPPQGSWDCHDCMVSNTADSLKCVACTAPKPGTEVANIIQPEKDSEHSTSKPFSFGSTNSSTFSFGATSTASSTEGFSFKKVATTGNPFLNLKKPEKGSWECPTCMVSNKPDSLKCVACTEPKPGSKDNSNAVQASVSQPTGSGFSFGTPSNGSSGFSFVPPNPSSSAGSGSGFSFVPSAPSVPSVSSEFSFGKTSNNSSGFSFGNSGNVPGFTFGNGAKTETKETEVKLAPTGMFSNNGVSDKIPNGPTAEVKPAPTGFNFGGANVTEKPLATSSNTGSSSMFGSVSSLDCSKVNGFPAAHVNSTPQFNFSSNATPSFLLNSTDNKPAEPPAKFSFNPGTMSTPNFNFGTVSSAAAIFGNPNTSGQFSFASNNNIANSNNDAPKVSMFANPSGPSNLFTIGGGSETQQRSERRKVKRAHRKLPARK